MKNIKNLSALMLENIIYGISGAIFTALCFWICEVVSSFRSNPMFGFQSEHTIGLIWTFLGLSLSHLICGLIFRKNTNYLAIKCIALLMLSTAASFLLQMAYLIKYSGIIENMEVFYVKDIYGIFGIRLFTKLFIILTPFVSLFTSRRLLLEKLKDRNALK